MKVDLIWSYGGTGIFAVAGLSISAGVAFVYGAEGLGIFNQVYAVFVVTGQLASGGAYESALRRIAASDMAEADMQASALAAALAGSSVAIPTSVLLWFAAPLIGTALGSEGVGEGLRAAAPALPLFSANSALLGALNGARKIRALAMSVSLRYAGIAIFLFALGWAGATAAQLPGAFLWAEVALLLVMLAQHRKGFAALVRAPIGSMVSGHLRFGLKAAPGSALTELNPRVDVIMVGVFLPDAGVGVYSFASLLAEGLLHLLAVLRVNVNPLLVPLLARKEEAAIQALLSRIKRLVYPAAAAVIVSVVGGFPILVAVLGLDPEFMAGWPVLTVLCAGVLTLSGHAAFGQILNQAGLPTHQSLATLASVLINTLLCVALIPPFGLMGAAASAVIALILQMLLVFALLRSKVGLRLL